MSVVEILDRCHELNVPLEPVFKQPVSIRAATMLPGDPRVILHLVHGIRADGKTMLPCNYLFDAPGDPKHNEADLSVIAKLLVSEESRVCRACATRTEFENVDKDYLTLVSTVADEGKNLLDNIAEVLGDPNASVISAGMIAEQYASLLDSKTKAEAWPEFHLIANWAKAHYAKLATTTDNALKALAGKVDANRKEVLCGGSKLHYAFLPSYANIQNSNGTSSEKEARLKDWATIILNGNRYAGKGFRITNTFIVTLTEEALELFGEDEMGNQRAVVDLGEVSDSQQNHKEVLDLASDIHFKDHTAIADAIKEAQSVLTLMHEAS